jgi:hypothetical protein
MTGPSRNDAGGSIRLQPLRASSRPEGSARIPARDLKPTDTLTIIAGYMSTECTLARE